MQAIKVMNGIVNMESKHLLEKIPLKLNVFVVAKSFLLIY